MFGVISGVLYNSLQLFQKSKRWSCVMAASVRVKDGMVKIRAARTKCIQFYKWRVDRRALSSSGDKATVQIL